MRDSGLQLMADIGRYIFEAALTYSTFWSIIDMMSKIAKRGYFVQSAFQPM